MVRKSSDLLIIGTCKKLNFFEKSSFYEWLRESLQTERQTNAVELLAMAVRVRKAEST